MVRILERLSLAAGPPANDDRAGGIGSPDRGAAWVIDGATGLADRCYVPGAASDAAWFAERLDRAMTRQAMLGGPLALQMRRAYAEANAAFGRAVEECVPDFAKPIATLLVVAWQEAADGEIKLDYASLGDGSAILAASRLEARRLGPPLDVQPDALVNAAVRALQEAGTGDPEAVMAAMREPLREARARAVRRFGLWAEGASDGEAALDLESLAVRPPGILVLATDGFYRLVDTYAAYDLEGLVQAASLMGLGDLGRELRAIEDADAGCRAYPRLKPRDDATAVLITLDGRRL